jgi:hypothetical protein
MAIAPPYSIWRSLISSAARRRIASRSRHGVAAHAGWAARAAAIASTTSRAVARANVPITMSRSIGVRTSNAPSPSRQAPFT